MTNVQIIGTEIIGQVIDSNEIYATVETANDFYTVKKEQLIEVVEQVEQTQVELFENALKNANLSFEGFVDGEQEYTYYIVGFTYNVMAVLDLENNEFIIDTKHKGRENDKDWHNAKTYKKLDTLIKNVIKWTDK